MSSEDAIIRIATPEDKAAIFRVVNAAYALESEVNGPVAFKSGNRWDTLDELDTLFNAFDTQIYVLDASSLLGVAVVRTSSDGASAFLGPLAVDPVSQDRGYGTRLLKYVEEQARAAGIVTMKLVVVDWRTDLLGYYEKFGYRAVGSRRRANITTATKPCEFIEYSKILIAQPPTPEQQCHP